MTEEDETPEARDPALCFGPNKLSLVTLARNQQVLFEYLKRFKDLKVGDGDGDVCDVLWDVMHVI